MNRLEPLLALRAQDFRRFILIERENRHGNEKKIGNRMVGVGKQTPHFAQRRFVLRRTNQPEHALKVEVGVFAAKVAGQFFRRGGRSQVAQSLQSLVTWGRLGRIRNCFGRTLRRRIERGKRLQQCLLLPTRGGRHNRELQLVGGQRYGFVERA